MNLTDGSVYVFPQNFAKQSIETYTKRHGQAPRYLVASEEEYFDWLLSSFGGAYGAGRSPTFMGCTIVPGKYLKVGQIDLALDIKPQKKTNKKSKKSKTKV